MQDLKIDKPAEVRWFLEIDKDGKETAKVDLVGIKELAKSMDNLAVSIHEVPPAIGKETHAVSVSFGAGAILGILLTCLLAWLAGRKA